MNEYYYEVVNELCNRVECGELTLEDAEYINEIWFNKCITESFENIQEWIKNQKLKKLRQKVKRDKIRRDMDKMVDMSFELDDEKTNARNELEDALKNHPNDRNLIKEKMDALKKISNRKYDIDKEYDAKGQLLQTM